MTGSRMTFIAEFVDRLTGPSKKAAKAVEDLGKASQEAAQRSEKANTQAERAEVKRARATKRAAEIAAASEARRAKAAEDAAKRTERANRSAEESEKRRTKVTATESARSARSAVNHADRIKEAITGTSRAHHEASANIKAAISQESRAFSRSQADAKRTGDVIGQMVGRTNSRVGLMGRKFTSTGTVIEQMANRTGNQVGLMGRRFAASSDVIAQMAQRSSKSFSGMQSTMDRVNPGRMASRYNDSLSRMLSRTEQVSGKIQGHLESITNSGAVRGAQVGATVVGGMALTGGARRIADTQQADVVLETMGIDEAGRKELLGQYKGLAQNTPYATGSVAMLGSGLLSAGMSQDDLQGALQGAIDTGALYGMSLDEIGLPLKQIQAKGKAQGDDIMQLTDRGIPIYKWIAEQKGVDQSKVADLVSKGQVSSDDVFQALAKNSEGGAEKAAGTLKGSWTNFLSSISQGGEAFLTPLVGPLTDLLKGAKDTISAMKPALSILGQVTAVIVKGLTPALPVLIPLVVALGGGLLALAAAAKAALVVKSVATGLGMIRSFLGGRGRGRGATGAVGLFTEFLGGMRDGAREAYGQRGLGGLNAGLDTSTKKMGKAQGAAKGLMGSLRGMGGLAATAGGVLGGMLLGSTSGINADSNPEGAANSIATGGDVNAEFRDKKWANKNGSILGGTMSGVNGIGDVVNKKQHMGAGDKIAGWFSDGKIFGYKDGWQKGFDSLAEQDSALASMAGSPEAGNRWNTILADVQRAGASPQDALAAFPEYKAAVTSRLSEMNPPVRADDNVLLQYMGNTAGYRSGGFTGMGSASAIAGVVHGREYVMPESVTSRPGMLPTLRQIHRTGEVPRTYNGDTTSVQVNVDASGATVEAAQAVGQSVEEAVARVLARRERRAANRHGTRELRGAN